MAMLAVNAAAFRRIRRKGADDRIVSFFGSRFQIAQVLLQLSHIARALHDRDDAGTIQRILDALGRRQCLTEAVLCLCLLSQFYQITPASETPALIGERSAVKLTESVLFIEPTVDFGIGVEA